MSIISYSIYFRDLRFATRFSKVESRGNEGIVVGLFRCEKIKWCNFIKY